MKLWKLFLLTCGMTMLLAACNRQRETIPSMDFATYISAYTGGSIASEDAVRIVFAQDMETAEPGKTIEKKVFSFSPSIKGHAFWENSHTIAFVPDSGALKQGKIYNAKFHLSEFFPVTRKLRRFPFSFHVQQKEFSMKLLPMEVTTATPDEVTLRGQLAFNEPVRTKDVKKMLRIKGKYSSIVFPETEKSTLFEFTVNGIEKSDKPQQIQLIADGKRIGIKEKCTVEAEIPMRNKFAFLTYENISAPENGIVLVFSEPVSTEQDLRGLIELPMMPSATMQVKENVVEIHYEEPTGIDSMPLRIAGSLQSSTGRRLREEMQLQVKTMPLAPQLALLSEGVILPDAENLKLNFKAASLQAVDVEVIRIYQRNVLSFLQVNKLDEEEDIRRAGRLVYRQKLQLNPPMSSVNAWHNYAVDLGRIIRQEEGAIYRVRLSFRREYATAPFHRSSETVTGNSGMTTLDPTISADDEAAWDEVNSYYTYFGYPYEDIYYYDDYHWRDRDNPYTASYYMANRSVSTNLLASNLGIMVKANDNGKYWVVVNDILTAEPVRGAGISLYNLQLQPVASGKTDHKGIAELETSAKPFIAVATKGKQSSYLRLVEGENNSYSRFDVSGEKNSNGLKGFLYGERGVWRPGDTLHLTLILEDRNHRIPENHPASLEIFNPRGQFHIRKVNPSSVDGFYTFAVPIPSDAPTGLWNAYVHVGQATFHKSLHIETVKPNRLNIDLRLPDTLLNIRNATNASLHAAWLTGAIASKMQAQVEMQTSKARVPVKGFEKYVFTNPLADASPQTVMIFDGKLSETGNAQITIPAMASGQLPGKIRAQFVCRVTEPGGDASVISKNAILSPYAAYVGIRSNLSSIYPYVETNTDHRFDIVTVSENGKLMNRSNLTYYIYKIDWSYWWENDEALSNYINNTNAKVVKSGRINTTNGKASIPFRVDYPEYGKYLIFIKDQGGHATGCLFNVDWPSWRGNPDTKNPSAVQMLTFSLDQPEYKVGDEVLVTIPKIQSGIALVSIENGSEVIDMHRVKINKDGITNFRFKVTEEMTPNAYVQISVLQPHRLTVDNMPIRLYGVEPFTVTDPKSMLTPKITCPKVIRPQQPFNVKVKENSGRPMTYTLAVVDEGLLSLTRFKTPDPWKKFHTREALGIRTWDVYNNVVGAFAGKYARMFSIGGDENLELSPAKANRFTPVVRFIGPFTLKKGETKNHTITLPQYVGAVRVMVVAGHDGAYGSAEQTTTVRTPLMLLPTLPRVLSVNESIELPVNVFAMEPSVKEVTLKVSTTGKAGVKGAATQKINFSHTGDKMAYFTLETGKLTGTEKITITATGNGHTAKEVVEIEIRNPNPLLTHTTSVLIDKQKTATLPYQLQQGGKESLLQLEVATLPSLNITSQFDFLENYRHACSEQLVSKALPLLFKEHFVTLTETDKKEIAASIESAVSNLYARQQPSGGFSYWPGERQVSDWLTSYVGHLLILAREKGYEVNQNVYNKWLGYQRKAAQNWQMKRKNAAGYSFTQSDLEQAYRLYTLALAGKAETGAMNRLKGQTGLSLQARWRLAAAYAISGKKQTALNLIQSASTTVPTYTSDNSTFGSSLRDEAMILETMILTDQRKEAFQQARLIAKEMQGEPLYSTHSSAYAIMAIAQLYDRFDNGMEFAWSQYDNAENKVSSGKAAYHKNLPLKNLSGKVTVQNNGKGTIYASLYQRSRPLTDTAAARQKNIALQVSYTDMSGKAISPNQLQQGTDFNVTIRVSNLHPSQVFRNVALTYILPSGWEVVNERYLDGYETSATGFSYQDIRDDRVFTYFDLPLRGNLEVRLRLRASYCGRFTLPAIKCEAMYDPKSYARTAAGNVLVTR